MDRKLVLMFLLLCGVTLLVQSDPTPSVFSPNNATIIDHNLTIFTNMMQRSLQNSPLNLTLFKVYTPRLPTDVRTLPNFPEMEVLFRNYVYHSPSVKRRVVGQALPNLPASFNDTIPDQFANVTIRPAGNTTNSPP